MIMKRNSTLKESSEESLYDVLNVNTESQLQMRKRNIEVFKEHFQTQSSNFSTKEEKFKFSDEHLEDSYKFERLGYMVLGSQDLRLTLMDEIILIGLKDKLGYLSFMNDSISFVLRGCIIMELALRQKIRVVRESRAATGTFRRTFCERQIEVVDGTSTGEIILDEAIKMIKSEKNSISSWINLLSGETWNPLKVGYQLKQVRERVAKGLVDKGVLRTEKQSFFLFDMATHPLVNTPAKTDVMRRLIGSCLGLGQIPNLRDISLVGAALTANVLEDALKNLTSTERRKAFTRAEEILAIYSSPKEESAQPLLQQNEIIAGVFEVFCHLDTIV